MGWKWLESLKIQQIPHETNFPEFSLHRKFYKVKTASPQKPKTDGIREQTLPPRDELCRLRSPTWAHQ